MNVLVAGGAGYIGSHTVKRLQVAGHRVVIYDNLCRGHGVVAEILKVPAVWADLNDGAKLRQTLREYGIETVMHFAAYAYVGESMQQPLMYYDNNVATTISVLQSMAEAQVNNFVFSSSCAVYGDPESVPISEDQRTVPVSPYGRSKLMVEQILQDTMVGNKSFAFASLRYFNAAGCAMDGTLGEDHDPETHLIPVVLGAILGVRAGVTVFGSDYPTGDGTNIRDYIHVDDLAEAHILAMEKLEPGGKIICNLGTGQGFSVKQVILAAEKVTGKKAPVSYGPRRAGDAVALWADPSLARRTLGWEPRHKEPETIIGSAWKWFSKHPRGYEK